MITRNPVTSRTAKSSRAASSSRVASPARSASEWTSPASTGYPPDEALSYVATPTVALPGYLTPFTDPTWGTKITRISNVATVRNAYSTRQAWNSDSTRMKLHKYAGGAGVLLDGTTYAIINASFNGAIQEYVWSNTDPDILVGGFGGDIRRWSASNDAYAEAAIAVSGYTDLDLGGGEGNQSDDDRYWPFIATHSGASGVMVYDMTGRTVVAWLPFTTTALAASSVHMSRSGLYCIVNMDAGGSDNDGTGAEKGVWLFDRTLGAALRQLTIYGGRHGEASYDANDNEVWAFVGNDLIRSVNLATGVATDLLAYPNALTSGHLSARNTARHGWVVISNYDSVAKAGQIGCDQIAAVKLDGSGTVEVFAHAHHGAEVYASDPMATVSRDGKRVLFASEWDATNVYAYVAEAAI